MYTSVPNHYYSTETLRITFLSTYCVDVQIAMHSQTLTNRVLFARAEQGNRARNVSASHEYSSVVFNTVIIITNWNPQIPPVSDHLSLSPQNAPYVSFTLHFELKSCDFKTSIIIDDEVQLHHRKASSWPVRPKPLLSSDAGCRSEHQPHRDTEGLHSNSAMTASTHREPQTAAEAHDA